MFQAMRRSIFWLAIGSVLLAACDGGQATDEESLDRARAHLESGDTAAALIELKNAVQANPESATARAFLGEIYLRTGNPVGAAKELQRAVELGVEDEGPRVLLAQARLRTGEFQAVVDAIPADQPADGESGAILLALRGQALLGLARFDEAQETFERVNAERPVEFAYAGLARLALLRGDTAAAAETLDAGLGAFPDNAVLKVMRGEQQMQARAFEAARDTFAALSKDEPNNLPAGIGLARAEMALGRVEPARVVIDDLAHRFPSSGAVVLLRSIASLQAHEFLAAQQDANAVLAAEPDNPTAQYVAGAASYALEQYEQALNLLSHYTTQMPDDPAGRKLLAATQVRTGDLEAARRTLGDDALADDPTSLAMLGTATALSGDIEAGLEYLESAVLRSPEDARLRARLGMMRVAAGDAEQGAADLDRALELDPGLIDDPRYDRAEIALIQSYLTQRKFDEALAAIADWQQQHPDDATGYVMEGVAHAAGGNDAEGREAFRKALELRPGAPDASRNLAILELRSGSPAGAERVLEQVLDHHPDDLQTLLLLAQLAERTGERDKTRSWLERAVAAHPDEPQPRIVLGRLYFEQGEPEKALTTVEPALRQLPDNAAALQVKARAELQTGHTDDAIATYRRMIAAAPGDAQAQFELSQAYAVRGDLDQARAAAEAALAAEPEHAAARLHLARLALGQGDLEAAEDAISALEADFPDAADVKAAAGELAMARNDPETALAAFQAARASADSSRLAIAEARAHAAAGDRPAALATLERWLDSNPSDTVVRLELARAYQATGRRDDAKAGLRQIIEAQPNAWVARNELAWMLYQDGDTAAARPIAERALELAPDNPAVMDTLGVILLQLGETERATALIRRANESVGDNPEIGFHLAQAYAKSSREDEARQLLAALLEKHPTFTQRGDAEALLAELGG